MSITDGDIRIFTFKEGILSRVAHDLQLTLHRFDVTVDDGEVSCRFWPESITVDGAIMNGNLRPNTLKNKDKKEIVQNIQTKILHTSAHPTAELRGQLQGDGAQTRLTGTLQIAGRTRPFQMAIEHQEHRWTGEVSIKPTDWGIQPFRALMGAIRLQDRILVRFDLPHSEGSS